jgi:hypothetical protein
MSFVPIKLHDYVRKHLKANPGSNERDETAQLRDALARYKAGARCYCGEPIWVIGSAQLGDTCFTCATGEADPSDDYEIAEACNKRSVRHDPGLSLPSVSDDSDTEDCDVPF